MEMKFGLWNGFLKQLIIRLSALTLFYRGVAGGEGGGVVGSSYSKLHMKVRGVNN